MNRSAHTTRFGFTLIEMLVVVSIIVIVMAISFPMIGAMRRDSSASAGINTISVAIPSVRRYATDDRTFSSDLDPTTPTIVELGIYSGAAAIFTPAGEIRLTRNIDTAKSRDLASIIGFKYLEQHGPRAINKQGPGLPKRELNGFEDIDIDYLLLPSDTGVAGINRVCGSVKDGLTAADDGPPLLLPPPFAVWYNQSGYLVATGWDASNGHHNDYQYVYYDGDYDGDFKALDTVAGSFRGTVGAYNPDTFNPNGGTGADPQAPDFNPANWNVKEEKYELPFEALEAVVGIYVYSRDDFEQANVMWRDGETNPKYAAPAWTNTSLIHNEARWLWMREHGEMIMFSKQTGALMRNRDE